MKKILFLAFIFSLLNADDFRFDPKTDSVDNLRRFCLKTKKQGIDFGEQNTNKELCAKYVDEAIAYYDKECENNNVEACLSASNIYAYGLGNVQENDDKALEIDEKVCSLKEKIGCHIAALVYLNKSHNTDNKSEAKEFKNKAKMYYKESCKLGNEWDCKEEKTL